MLLAQQAALNYDAAGAAASALRETLLPAVYFFCFLGFVETAYYARGDGERILLYVIGLACIVIIAVSFPAAMTYLQVAINGMMETHNEHVNNLFYQMLNANLGEPPSIWDVGNYILYGIIKLLQGIGRFGIIIIELIQSVSILALVGISPILIGMLATSWTRSSGVRFLLTSLIVCLWSVGIALCDLVLFAVGQYIFAGALTAGGAAGIAAIGAGTAAGLTLTTLAMPALLLAMAIACFVPLALYLAIPIVMYAVMMGANPITSALGAGAGMAATGMAVVGANAARSIATAGGLASRSMGGAASGSMSGASAIGSAPPIAPPVQGLTPPSSGSGGASGSVAGNGDGGGSSAPAGEVVRQSSGAYAAASGAAHRSAPAGYQVNAPGGGAMTASQIDIGNFSVTDSSGASRNFTGNLGNAQTLARAYNNMISTPAGGGAQGSTGATSAPQSASPQGAPSQGSPAQGAPSQGAPSQGASVAQSSTPSTPTTPPAARVPAGITTQPKDPANEKQRSAT
jgi:hypothetical protein